RTSNPKACASSHAGSGMPRHSQAPTSLAQGELIQLNLELFTTHTVIVPISDCCRLPVSLSPVAPPTSRLFALDSGVGCEARACNALSLKLVNPLRPAFGKSASRDRLTIDRNLRGVIQVIS